MATAELTLEDLEARGFTARLDDGRLMLNPASKIDDGLAAAIRAAKAGLVVALKAKARAECRRLWGELGARLSRELPRDWSFPSEPGALKPWSEREALMERFAAAGELERFRAVLKEYSALYPVGRTE